MVLGWKHSIIDNRLDLELFKLDGGRVEGELHGEHQLRTCSMCARDSITLICSQWTLWSCAHFRNRDHGAFECYEVILRRVEEPDDDGVPVGVEEVLYVGWFGEGELLPAHRPRLDVEHGEVEGSVLLELGLCGRWWACGTYWCLRWSCRACSRAWASPSGSRWCKRSYDTASMVFLAIISHFLHLFLTLYIVIDMHFALCPNPVCHHQFHVVCNRTWRSLRKTRQDISNATPHGWWDN